MHIQDLSRLINEQPALRYGRQYFRALSGNETDFGYSPYPGGVLAFSRILNDKELLVAANTNVSQPATIQIIVDKNLNSEGKQFSILFPFNKRGQLTAGCKTTGLYRTVEITIDPCEALVIG